MCAPRRFIALFVLFLAGAFASTATLSAFAGAPGAGAGSPKLKPDVEKKIYTNEDLEAMAAPYGASLRQIPGVTTRVPQQSTGVSSESPRSTALPKDQNPVWYAEQMVTMQTELARIDAEIAELRQPPASSTSAGGGVGGGFGLYTCCPGITTYNRIDQLMQLRQEIAAQMNAIEDTARVNGLSPGMLRESGQILQAAETRVAVTPQQRLAALAENEKALSEKLVQLQETLDSINEQAASQNITLAPLTTAYGGSMLTNSIVDLENQARGLQQKISDFQAAEHASGVPLGAQP
jgi:hypothetical protein